MASQQAVRLLDVHQAASDRRLPESRRLGIKHGASRELLRRHDSGDQSRRGLHYHLRQPTSSNRHNLRNRTGNRRSHPIPPTTSLRSCSRRVAKEIIMEPITKPRSIAILVPWLKLQRCGSLPGMLHDTRSLRLREGIQGGRSARRETHKVSRMRGRFDDGPAPPSSPGGGGANEIPAWWYPSDPMSRPRGRRRRPER